MKDQLLLGFLESLLASVQRGFLVRLNREELGKGLAAYLKTNKIDKDPILAFEEFERNPPKSEVIAGHLFHYNVYREELTIEAVPTLEQMEHAAEVYSSNVKGELVRRIRELGPMEFQRLIAEVFSRLPWTTGITMTPLTRDSGIDFRGTYKESDSDLTLSIIGQAKHGKSEIGPEAIRAFLGTLAMQKNPTVGIFVSSSGFSADALMLIHTSRHKIVHYDAQDLSKLLVQHRIGVTRFTVKGTTIDEQFWNEITE